jgi:hypothetical protein
MKNPFATLVLASLYYSAPGVLFAGPQSDPAQPAARSIKFLGQGG